jgi:hypothetical protein
MKNNIGDLIRNKLFSQFYYNLPVFVNEDLDQERLDQSDNIQYIFFSVTDCFE